MSMMKRIETDIFVTDEGQATLAGLHDVGSGMHHAVIVIDDEPKSKPKTCSDLAHSEIVGLWKDMDIDDSSAYARTLIN